MKKRNGFVSNSSSSSFILVGSEIDNIQLILDSLNSTQLTEVEGLCNEEYPGKLLSELKIHELVYLVEDINDNILIDEGRYFLGKLLVDNDDELPEGSIKITEDMVGKNIIYGTRMC